MGLRFRRSKKIAPGVKLNLSKKGASVSFGTRGAHYTVNTGGKRTATVGIPGSGISYSASSGGRKRSSFSRYASPENVNVDNGNLCDPNEKKSGNCLMYVIAFLAVCVAIWFFSYFWILALILLAVIPFLKIDKKTKIIDCIFFLVVGIISFLVFGFMQEEKSGDSVPSTEVIVETDLQSETETQLATDTEAITETAAETEALIDTEFITETEQQTETPEPKYYYSMDTVNVRSAPSTDSDIIGSLNKSDRIHVESIDGEWASVIYDGSSAFVAAQYLSETVPQTEPGERMVWIPESGTKYHSNPDCSGMNDPRQVTVNEAESLGYEPCSKC